MRAGGLRWPIELITIVEALEWTSVNISNVTLG